MWQSLQACVVECSFIFQGDNVDIVKPRESKTTANVITSSVESSFASATVQAEDEPSYNDVPFTIATHSVKVRPRIRI